MLASETRGMRSRAFIGSSFAEPDWQGDCDYDGELEEINLDAVIRRLQALIEAGAVQGWLGAYHARRAAFDLQSIRSQIDRERRRWAGDVPDGSLRAIQSRADRLANFLDAAGPA